MKLADLHEGLIKIPDALMNTCMDFVLNTYLSQVYTQIGDQIPMGIFNEVIEHYSNQYELNIGKLPSDFVMNTVKIKIPKSIIDKNYRGKGDSNRVLRLVVGDISSATDNQNIEGLMSGVQKTLNTVFIRTSHYLTEDILKRIAGNPDVLYQIVQKLEGVTEHELTHVIQRDYLSAKHKIHSIDTAAEYYNDDMTTDYDKFLMSNIEQDPTLKSSIHDFIMLVSGYEKLAKKPMSKEKIKAIYDYFTNPNAAGQTVVLHPQYGAKKLDMLTLHTPLRVWHSKDINKWKTGVKYFYGRVKQYL